MLFNTVGGRIRPADSLERRLPAERLTKFLEDLTDMSSQSLHITLIMTLLIRVTTDRYVNS